MSSPQVSGEYIALEDRLGAHNYHPLEVVIERAEGAWVWDVDGQRYLDCLAAYSAVNQGHCHPRIIEALVKQAHRATLSSRAFYNDQLSLLYRRLHEFAGYDRALPMNTGAEAVETALKAMRKWGYTKKGIPDDRAEILVFDGNFHGRTTTIVGFSSEEQYRSGFGPFTPGFRLLPYGDADAVEEALSRSSFVAGILVEPIQGEAGIVMPPKGFLKRLRELCDEHHCLFAVDEIQSGLGRTGRNFCFEHEGVRPDLVIIGKALAGGVYPVSAVLADDEVMSVFTPGDHGSTFGGNPLGAAAAIAAIDVLVEEKLVENSARLGEIALRELAPLTELPSVKEVRGIGLWIGLELDPSAGGARRYCEALRNEGLLCKETHEHVIRFAPPLVISEEDLLWALERIRDVVKRLAPALS